MSKLKLWNQHANWEAAEQAWDAQAQSAAERQPNKGLKVLPNMPGMTEETARFFKWKAFKWIIAKDHGFKVLKKAMRHPFRYGWNYFKSLFWQKSYLRDGDFFLYGISSVEEFHALMADPSHVFVVGFSYCHKPFECPSGRFTDQCVHDAANPVCQQCFIGKAVHALPERVIPVFIPTVHYIGNKIFELMEANPGREVIFIITACEMTLEMFGDWGNMVGIKGIGVRLDGRICNTMKAFELSEEGIKPGLTVVTDETQRRILDLIKLSRE